MEYTVNYIKFHLDLHTLLYADDTIILCASPQDLQKALNALSEYCKTWKLEVNKDKTKVVVFSKGKVRNVPKWTFGDGEIDTVDDYVYLGTTFNFNGSFTKAMTKQATQAKWAMYGLIGKARKMGLPTDIQIHLFNALILPILLYGCEMWGYCKLDIIEKVQLFFLKTMLKLNKSTPNCVVLGETGSPSIEDTVNNRMLNYWAKLVLGKQSKITVTVYKILRQKSETGEFEFESNWVKKIHDTLNNLGFGDIWLSDNPTNLYWFKHVIKNRIHDTSNQNWHTEINNKNWCRTYRLIKDDKKLEKCVMDLNPKEAITLCRFRAGNHRLPIVQGRYNKVPFEDRKCQLCNLKEIGSEAHYVLRCPYFNENRCKFLNLQTIDRSNDTAIKSLFQTENLQELKKLALFLSAVMEQFKK